MSGRRRTAGAAGTPWSGGRIRAALPYVVVALALLVRLPDLRWGLPVLEEEATPVHKAFEMWGWDEGRLDLDPKTAGWPALSFYVQLLLQHVLYAFGLLTGRYGDRLDFFLAHLDIHTLVAPARFLSVLAGTGVVLVGMRIARRLTSAGGAAAVGLLLALSPLLVEHSLKVTPDILLTLFSALALLKLVDVHERGRTSDYVWCAVWIGLGAASKYTPVLLIPCLVVAHLIRRGDSGRRPSLGDRRLLLAALVCAGTFVAASPYTVLNAAVAAGDISSQYDHVVAQGHFGHELKGSGHVFYLLRTLPSALGLPALVLGLAGLAVAAWKRRGAWVVVLLSFVTYYLGIGALRSIHSHYILPAVLPVVLGLAALTGALRERWGARPRAAAVVLPILLVVVLVPPAVNTYRQHLRFARPSTFHQATTFVREELDWREAHFVCELGGPALPLNPALQFMGRRVFARLDPERRKRIENRPYADQCQVPMYSTDAHGADIYYDLRHYVHYDYIVVSGTARDRYVALAEEFPRQNEFYRDLERYCTLLRHFPASPEHFGPDVWIYAVDEATSGIRNDRGPLLPGFHEEFMPTVRKNHLQMFLAKTASLALEKQDWKAGDLYLTTLFLTTPPAERTPAKALQLARVKLRAGNVVEAAELCAELMRLDPDAEEVIALQRAIGEAPAR